MRLLRGLHNVPRDFDGCVATIGNFDGLHLGHQCILAALRTAANDEGKPTLVILFEPQPKEFFAPDFAPPRLASFREKFLDLQDAGVDYLLCLPFNEALRRMTADAFISEVLIQALKVRHLIVGDDFRFGCDRSGDYQALVAAGSEHGFAVDDTPTHEIDAERVSSTRVRTELSNDNLAAAAVLLDHPYRMSGRIAYGRQLGRTLDTPTANVMIKRTQLPMTGVFAVHATLADNHEEYIGVANLGVKPTVAGTPEPSLEVHLFGFKGDIYGQHLTVEFLHKIRDEMKFDGLDALRTAIQSDKDAARSYFAARPDSFRF